MLILKGKRNVQILKINIFSSVNFNVDSATYLYNIYNSNIFFFYFQNAILNPDLEFLLFVNHFSHLETFLQWIYCGPDRQHMEHHD